MYPSLKVITPSYILYYTLPFIGPNEIREQGELKLTEGTCKQNFIHCSINTDSLYALLGVIVLLEYIDQLMHYQLPVIKNTS